MASARDPLVLDLVGPLRLLRPDGSDATPRLRKAQGVLALLGTARGLRRPRPWVQDKLWSDRQAEQGAASLRHALATIRAALGDDQAALVGETGWIGLDPARVEVRLDPAPADLGRAEVPEFCEGLDVRDPEFEDWIRDQRTEFEARFETAQAQAAAPTPVELGAPRSIVDGLPPPEDVAVVVGLPEADEPRLATLGGIIGVQAAAQLSRTSGLDVRLEPLPPGGYPTGEAMRLQLRLSRLGPSAFVHAELADAERSTLIWATSRLIRLEGRKGPDPDEVGALVAEITAATGLELGRGGGGAPGANMRTTCRALRSILSFRLADLDWADRALAGPDELPGAAVRRAWRAHIRVLRLIERIGHDAEAVRAEAIELAARAMEADPLNPVVNALASDVALHAELRPLKAFELAKAAVERDAANPFAHASLAQAQSRIGNREEAHAAALRALKLSVGQPNHAWWSMRCSVTAVCSGRLEEAARFAQVSHELSPDFRPPLRFLAALRYRGHDEAGAHRALLELRQLEPDFSLELMATDDYPVASLRETGLLEVTGSKLL